jgi:hypothetical protein
MTNPAMKLDTLAYAKRLIAAGCTQQLAEAHASAQQDTLVEISQDYLSQFVTKQDLLATKQELKQEILTVKQELTQEILTVKQELTQEILTVKQELTQEILTVKQELTQEILTTKQDLALFKQEINARFDTLTLQITVRFGAMLTAAVFVLAAILKLHW